MARSLLEDTRPLRARGLKIRNGCRASAVGDGIERDREVVEGGQPEPPRDLAGRDRRPEVDRAGAVEAQEAGAEPQPQRHVEIAPALGGVRFALEPAGVGLLLG
jgi:hypothetical protein